MEKTDGSLSREAFTAILENTLRHAVKEITEVVRAEVSEALLHATVRTVDARGSAHSLQTDQGAQLPRSPSKHYNVQPSDYHEPKTVPLISSPLRQVSDSSHQCSEYTRVSAYNDEESEGPRRHLRTNTKDSSKRGRVRPSRIIDAQGYMWDNDAVEVQTKLKDFVSSDLFDWCVGILVILSCLAMGVEANVRCASKGVLPLSLEDLFDSFEALFCCLFVLELSLRFYVYRCMLFCGDRWYWSIFDVIMVITQLVDIFADTFVAHNNDMNIIPMLRMARFLRVIRIFRAARLLHLFGGLNTVVLSIFKAFEALFSAMVLLALMIYSFSVLLTNMVAPYVDINDVHYWFGSLGRTSVTLMECVLGGAEWDMLIWMLYSEIKNGSATALCIFIIFGQLVIMNVVTGVFVNKAAEANEEQTTLIMANSLTKALLQRHDATLKNSEIQWDAFEHMLQHPAMIEFFNVIKVDISEAKEIFNLIDIDGSGTVDAMEMVEGMIRLAGPAKSIDLSLLMHQLHFMNSKINDHISRVDMHVEHVGVQFEHLCKRMNTSEWVLPANNQGTQFVMGL